MTETPSDLDILMSHLADLEAKDVTLWQDHDIDAIIEYQRRQRASREAGVKPKKPTRGGGGIKMTLADLGFKKPAKAVVPGTGLRRL